MRRFCSRLGLLVVMVAGLSACAGPVAATHASPAPHASAPAGAPADPQRCARLARRGFTPCPPTADRLQLPPTTIRNATNGAIPDATAQQWARAFQLTEAYYRWALQANARSALTSGAFADPRPQAIDNLFGNDLMELDNAQQAHGTLVVAPLRIDSVQAVSIPAGLQASMQRQGLTVAQFGLAVRFVGPSRRSIRLDDGTERLVSSADANYAASLLIWGEPKADADLGHIWYEHGNYGCVGSVQVVCQP